MLLTGCAAEEPVAAPSPSPTPSPEPSPTVTIAPVAGERTVTAVSVSSDEILGLSSDPEPDMEAITAFAESVAAWLDRHLDDLQQGGPGALADVARPELLEDADPALLDRIGAALTDPDRPVETASYDIRVSHAGVPVYARVTVRVDRQLSDSQLVTLAFLPDGDGVRLVLAGEAGA